MANFFIDDCLKSSDDSGYLYLSDFTKQVLHSALRLYLFNLESGFCDISSDDHYNSILSHTKFLLRVVFGDEIVKDEKYTDLPF